MTPSFSASSAFSSSSLFDPHWALYPHTYLVRPAPFPLMDQIDGNVEKDVWKKVPWSEPWGDIQGQDDAPPDNHSPALTRFKALYDGTHLYIACVLDPSPDFITQAHFHKRNEPIFQKDSDFEVFVDPFSNHFNYKELEVNAINTVWNLLLDKPYQDNGCEHSGRVAQPGDDLFYEVYHQKTATRVVHGKLNDKETGKGAQWSIEVALAYRDLYVELSSSSSTKNGETSRAATTPMMEQPDQAPHPGTLWRVNFSRVELKGEVNWTWQPQVIWDPIEKRHRGVVDMHQPNAWGYFAFVGSRDDDITDNIDNNNDDEQDGLSPTSLSIPRDPFWPVRLACMNVYYAQRAYRDQTGHYAEHLQDLKDLVDPAIVQPFSIHIAMDDNDGYLATIQEPNSSRMATIRHDRLLNVSDTLLSTTAGDSNNA